MSEKRYKTYASWLRESDEARVFRESFLVFDGFPAALPASIKRQVHDVLFRASKHAWIEYRDGATDGAEKKKKRGD